MPDGGSTAAFGFSFQYLATAAFVLQLMRESSEFDPALTTLEVEPPGSADLDDSGDDIVDFAVLVDDVVRTRVQVKASRQPDTRALAPAEARRVFDRLDALESPGRSVLLTNRKLAPSLEKDCSPSTGMRIGTTVNWTEDAGDSHTDTVGRQIVVAHDVAELESVYEELVRGFRRDKSRSQGVVSSRVVGIILRHRIFEAAAGNQRNTIAGEQLLTILTMPDARIAHAVGGFDWGNLQSRVPNVKSPVPRLDILDKLGATLEAADRTPPVVVLTGHTGTGKSIIASDYCHLNHNHYELVLWLDARDDGLLQAQIRDHAARITGGTIGSSRDVNSLLATALCTHRGPWLVVFDDAPGRREIEPYIPTIGHGAILVTTTNSTGWWPTAHVNEVGPFDAAQALRCFASYAGIDDATIPSVATTIEAIVRRLGLIPLAVSMAGLYFRNAAGELADLAPDYFRTLDALDDTLAIPPGFNRTAFAAVTTAVDQIGASANSPYTRNTKILVYTASFIAPEMIPLNLMIPATTDPIQIDMANLPKPSAADATITRAIVSLLRTQTIAHRVLANTQNQIEDLSADCIQIHPLINEILRTKYVATAPPGAVQNAVTVLLGHLIPWLGTMRTVGSFLALEQLRVHAETLLDFLNENEPLSSLSAKHQEVYLFAKAGVMAEVANCYANTARMQKSVSILNQLVVHYLKNFPDQEWAQVLAMKHASDMLADMSRASVPPPQLFQIAGRVLGMLKKLGQSDTVSTKATVYTTAHLSVQMVEREAQYRDHPILRQVAAEIEQIAERDPDKSSSAEWLMRQLNKRIHDDDYAGVLAELPRLRAVDTLPNDKITMDAVEVTALLHTGQVDTAFRNLDTLLAVDIVENHMVLDLRSALSKVAQALYQLRERHAADPRFRAYFDRIGLRIGALDCSIQAVQPRHDPS